MKMKMKMMKRKREEEEGICIVEGGFWVESNDPTR